MKTKQNKIKRKWERKKKKENVEAKTKKRN